MATPPASDKPPVLAVTRLSVRRNETTILRNISWQVQPGEHWVILGSNGSGKTSLLLALTGYLTPSCGEIELFGQRFGEVDWRKLRQRVGLVSSVVRQRIPAEESALETVISGRCAVIGFWGKPLEEERARAKYLLRQAGCAHLAGRQWGLFSQGERQRILIARALMADPVLLILDEPCAGLDPVVREQFFPRATGGISWGAVFGLSHASRWGNCAGIFARVVDEEGSCGCGGRERKSPSLDRLQTAFGKDVRLVLRAGRYRLIVSPKTRPLL